MTTTRRLAGAMLAAWMLVFASAFTPLSAQPAQPTAGKESRGYALIPGAMTGPNAIGPIGRRRFCDARSAGLAQLRTAWVARLLRLNEQQNKALDGPAAASAKAVDMFGAACPRPPPRLQTAPAQFDMMEKRIENAAQAMKTVRPAFDVFYNALDEGQKAKLDELGPKRSGWLW